jgi:predicted NBD/HSP70 family sugar kinase
VLENYIVLGPRSGFGIAMVIGGKVMTGVEHAAGEIGRWPWKDGIEMQDALSAPAVWRRLAGKTKRATLPVDLHAALMAFKDQRGEAWASIVSEYAHVLSCLHLLLDVPTYFLHGPLTALGVAFCEAIKQQVMPALKGRSIRLLPSSLGDGAGALGAASLAMEAWHPSE